MHKLFFIYGFILTIIFSPYCINGDQYIYIDLYSNLTKYNLLEGYYFYNNKIGSSEPFYYLFIYAASHLIDRNYLNSFVNGFLIYLISKLIEKYKLSKIYYVFLPLNYYLLVLFFNNERLKISFVFLILYLLICNKKKWIFLLMSFLSQYQNLIAILILRIYNKKSIKKFLIFGFLFGAIVSTIDTGLIFIENFKWKLYLYLINNNPIFGIIKLWIYGLISYKLSPDKKNILAIYFLLTIICLIVGSDRIVIYAYIITTYLLSRIEKGDNLLNLTINSYMAIKGIIFLHLVIEYGDAFAVT